MNQLPPGIFLFFLAPLTSEYVSGSSPYLNPFVLLANLLLYGPGALLIREFRARRRKGWPAVFILAAAYMIFEEGFMLNTLFDPTQHTEGRALGVNWIWAAGMLIVHSLVSIFAPILLAEAIYDECASEPWLKPKTYCFLLAIFLADVFGLGRLLASSNRPPTISWLVEGGIVVACFALAAATRGPQSDQVKPVAARTPLRRFVSTLAGMFMVMVVGVAIPALPIPSPVKLAIMLASYFGYLEWLRRSGVFRPELDRLSRFAVASGILSFWIAASPLMSIAKGNPGPFLFAALLGAYLVKAARRLRAARPAGSAPA